MKEVVICVQFDDSNGTAKYDVDPTHDAKHENVSKFDFVKSANITYTRARKNLINFDNLRETTHKNNIQERRLNNILRLDR